MRHNLIINYRELDSFFIAHPRLKRIYSIDPAMVWFMLEVLQPEPRSSIELVPLERSLTKLFHLIYLTDISSLSCRLTDVITQLHCHTIDLWIVKLTLFDLAFVYYLLVFMGPNRIDTHNLLYPPNWNWVFCSPVAEPLFLQIKQCIRHNFSQ